jgi:hypothetical protein
VLPTSIFDSSSLCELLVVAQDALKNERLELEREVECKFIEDIRGVGECRYMSTPTGR